MLLEDIERLMEENEDLKPYRGRYYDKDKEAGILTSEKESWNRGEVL